MADDEKAVTTDTPSAAHPPGAEPSGPTGSEAPGPGPASVWTASDARGPLETAAERGEAPPATEEPPVMKPHDDAVAVEALGEPLLQTSTPEDMPPPAEVAPKAQERRSFLPIAAGVVIGALIGAGSAGIVYAMFGGAAGGSSPDPQVASLSSRVDALEHRPDPQAGLANLKGAVADLDGKVSKLQAQAGASAVAAPAPAPAVDLTPVQQKISALQASLDALKSQSADTKALEAKVAALDSDVAGAKKDNTSTQAGIADVAGAQKLLAGKVMVPALAVVADSLVQQIDQGQPYASQVDALSALGADAAKIAVLRQNADTGVPSAKTLAAKFEPLAEPITATAHKAPPNAGFVDRLKSGMFSMVSVRGVDDTSGTDLPSRVARIRADLAHDDVAAALAAWGELPPEAQAKGEAWSALAKTSAEAMVAARALQHDAIIALGAKKS